MHTEVMKSAAHMIHVRKPWEVLSGRYQQKSQGTKGHFRAGANRRKNAQSSAHTLVAEYRYLLQMLAKLRDIQ